MPTTGRALCAALTAIILVAVGVAATPAAADPPSGSFTGVVDGAEFRVEVPSGWTGWWSALAPRPDDPDERIRQQGLWLRNAYIGGYTGPVARLDAAVREFPPEDQTVIDLSTFPFPVGVMPPAFVRFEAPVLLRPSR